MCHDHITQASEEWRDIPGYEGLYQASDLGAVKSLGRSIQTRSRWGTLYTRHDKETILSPSLHRGYWTLCLFDPSGKKKTVRVHVAVANAFLGQRPGGHDLHHIDGDSTNNAVANLKYVPEHEHRSSHASSRMKGSVPVNRKLTEQDVESIRELLARGDMLQRSIARQFGVSRRLISAINTGYRR